MAKSKIPSHQVLARGGNPELMKLKSGGMVKGKEVSVTHVVKKKSGGYVKMAGKKQSGVC